MATDPQHDNTTNTSESKIFVSITLLLAVIAIIIVVAWIVHRIRPPVIVPAFLRNERTREEEQHRKEIENYVLESSPVVQYSMRLHQNEQKYVSEAHGSAQSTYPPRRQFHTSARAGGQQEETIVENSGTPDNKIRMPPQEHISRDKYLPGSRCEPNSCSICTGDFVESENVRILPCGHIYHQRCIDPWLLDCAGTCPLW
jgi:hypothetical protein